MAKASEQFRQSDVAFWGIMALVFGGLAVLGANISAVVPQNILAGLHKTRIDSASIDQLRSDVRSLTEQATRLRRDNTTLLNQFALQEQAGNDVIQRVGALEVSLPKLLEALPADADIDRSTLTSSIDEGQAVTFDADGGSVSVRQRPLELASPPPAEQPMPELVASKPPLAQPNASLFGIALGPSVTLQNAEAAWDDLSLKLGPLLFGLSPLVSDMADSDQKRIVVGPITQLTEAKALCERLERVSISCMPMPFGGTPLSL